MARPLVPPHLPVSTSQLSLAGASLLLCALALFMCASHTRTWRQRLRGWSACHQPDPVVLVHHSTQQLDEPEDVSLWRKNILMGGKCQLPDFSGVIIYDSNGTVVPPAKPPRPLLTWK